MCGSEELFKETDIDNNTLIACNDCQYVAYKVMYDRLCN